MSGGAAAGCAWCTARADILMDVDYEYGGDGRQDYVSWKLTKYKDVRNI